MRIAHLIPNLSGGIAAYFDNFIGILVKDPEIYNLLIELDIKSRNAECATQYEKRYESPVDSYIVRNIKDSEKEIPSIFRNKELEQVLLDIVDIEKIEIVHIHSIIMLPMSVIYAMYMKGVKIVFTSHDSAAICQAHRAFVKKDGSECLDPTLGASCADCFENDTVESAMLRYQNIINTMNQYCDARIAVSHYIKQLFQANGITSEIDVIPTGFESDEVITYPKKIDGIVNIMFSGIMGYQKGLIILLEALQGIDPQKYKLNIYGKGSEIVYKKVIQKAYADIHFEYHGQYTQEEKETVFGYNHILVVPSIGTEAAGLVQLEAYFHKMPCIISSAGGILEYAIKDASVVFESGNITELHGILEKLIDNPDIIQKMSENIKLLNIRTFQDVANDHIAIYKRILLKNRFQNNVVHKEYKEKCLSRGLILNTEEKIKIAMETINEELRGYGFYIFGTGNAAKMAVENLSQENRQGLLGYFDNNADLYKNKNDGYAISKPFYRENTKVLIASMWTKEMSKQLMEQGYNETDILKVFGG